LINKRLILGKKLRETLNDPIKDNCGEDSYLKVVTEEKTVLGLFFKKF